MEEKLLIMNLKITILVENYADSLPFSEWGFSAFIELGEKKYLFDTGYSGSSLIANAKTSGINLKNINGIILSHGHYDHTGGLKEVLEETGAKEIITHPAVFHKKYTITNKNKVYGGIKYTKEYLEDVLGASFNFQEKFYKISEKIYMTGEVPITNDFEKIPQQFQIKVSDNEYVPDTFLDDNSIIINTDKGLVIIFGCAHRGIVNIMNYAKEKLNNKIRAIIGGTHLIGASEDHFNYVINYLKNENISLIAPGHCTGMDKIYQIKSHFPNETNPAFCGKIFYL